MTPTSPTDPSLPIAEGVRSALVRRGFVELTPIQRAVLAPEAQGQNLRMSSQTGSGKTVAFGLVLAQDLADPAACQGTVALILTPTRELAAQVCDELKWLFAELRHISVEAVTGGRDLLRERTLLKRKPTVLVATPGRLLDHLRRGNLDPARVGHLLLDEADRMLDMGFAEELDAIIEALPTQRRSHLVSATFARGVLSLANRLQGEALAIQGTGLGQANDDIEHVATLVERGDAYAAMVNTLLVAHGQRVLVFVSRRADTVELAERLTDDGFVVQALSGDLSQAQRERALAAFRRGLSDVLVCTDVAARGLDVPEISLVIHADMPNDADTYTHRSGRTGRAGRKGRSLVLVPARGRGRASRLFKGANVAVAWRPAPTAEEVMAAWREHTANRAKEQLEHSVSDERMAEASALLQQHDPVALVASLLAMAAPKLPCRPKTIRAVVASPKARDGVARPAKDGPAKLRDGKFGDGPKRPRPAQAQEAGEERGHSDARGPKKAFERGPRASKPGHTAPGEHRGPGDRAGGGFVRFSINWGAHKGATARRLLSHVCRRGNVTSGQIGAIRIGPRSATFEVAQPAAVEFESRVQAPDARDPGLKILRASEDGAWVPERGKGAGKGFAGKPKRRGAGAPARA